MLIIFQSKNRANCLHAVGLFRWLIDLYQEVGAVKNYQKEGLKRKAGLCSGIH